MILLIDNYDSFSYNLYQLIGEINPNIKVIRNDALTMDEIIKLKPSYIVLSPGPGKPRDAGVCIDVVKKLGNQIPILGVCLGHQAICEAYGATVTYAKQLMHGKSSEIYIKNSGIFAGFEQCIKVARYHSLAAVKATIPHQLEIIGVSQDDEVMAVQHKQYPVFGLQFHPESILTPNGKMIIKNFLGGVYHN